ncbi:MAG: type II secretion system protein GspD [Burkholderiales bacterium RIFCSPHIGHO2_12_FULL_69_20]|nr:MAG: type II secretion system protein GspD [Burkholderiales bacterium RIFCSPHIGHO2_12_FULL_69_20]
MPLALALLMLPSPPLLAQDNAVAAPALPRRSSGGLKAGTPVTLNFVNADIEAVSRAMAAMTDRQILVDPRVKGVITVYSEQPMPVREAYLQYLAALRGLGFTVVDNAGLLKVVPEADAKLQAGTVNVGPSGQRGDQVLTQIFRLSHENPNNLVAVLRPLISPNNTINANPGNSTLIITDYADNLTRIGKIIAALDQPAATEVEVIPLQHGIASDMAALVQKLGEGGPTQGVPGMPGAAAGVSVLADARSNALIVRAANPARLASVRALIERLDRPGLGGPAGMIHVVYLKNADATKLAAVLRAAFGGGGGGGGSFSANTGTSTLPTQGTAGGAGSTVATTPLSASAQPSTGGFIQADPSTNSLVITAAEPLYRQIRGVIDQLDGRRALVFVESMIVEMDASKAAELGFQWQGLIGRSGDRYGLATGTNFGSGGNNILNLSTSASGTSLTLPGAGLNLGLLQKVNGVYTLGALARFLETVSGTNILSTPNLVALDNEEAKIVVGQNVPFVTGSFTNTGSSSATVNPFQTVERKDVGLTLKIKPQIGEGGVVRMTVYQENSSVVSNTATATNGPTTNKNSLETTVVADDGQIMVLGGQMKDEYTDGENKVPLLGDVPMMGNLFKSSSRERRKSVMLVFLRPVVIRDAQTATSLTMDRYEAIRAQQQASQPAPSSVMSINQGPVLPALPGSVPAVMPSTPPSTPPSAQPTPAPKAP